MTSCYSSAPPGHPSDAYIGADRSFGLVWVGQARCYWTQIVHFARQLVPFILLRFYFFFSISARSSHRSSHCLPLSPTPLAHVTALSLTFGMAWINLLTRGQWDLGAGIWAVFTIFTLCKWLQFGLRCFLRRLLRRLYEVRVAWQTMSTPYTDAQVQNLFLQAVYCRSWNVCAVVW